MNYIKKMSIFFLIIFLTGCSNSNNCEKISSHLESQSQIFSFENNTLYYFIETSVNDNTANLTLKSYNLNTHIDDIIILTTLNQRIIIFKEENNLLTRMSIPTELYKEFPSGYRIINSSVDKTKKVFFSNQFKDEKTIIMMGVDDYKFSYVDLPFKEQGLRRFHMDPDGNILI